MVNVFVSLTLSLLSAAETYTFYSVYRQMILPVNGELLGSERV